MGAGEARGGVVHRPVREADRDLESLDRGLVLDVTPIVTARADGRRAGRATGTTRSSNPQFGANVRWGLTSNLTLNGTIRPDFAEVESDAGQVTSDPRLTLFFPEKRPFFLDGAEQFSTPGGLIYTRRIASPRGAAKVAGHARRARPSPRSSHRTRGAHRCPARIVRCTRGFGCSGR